MPVGEVEGDEAREDYRALLDEAEEEEDLVECCPVARGCGGRHCVEVGRLDRKKGKK